MELLTCHVLLFKTNTPDQSSKNNFKKNDLMDRYYSIKRVVIVFCSSSLMRQSSLTSFGNTYFVNTYTEIQ